MSGVRHLRLRHGAWASELPGANKPYYQMERDEIAARDYPTIPVEGP